MSEVHAAAARRPDQPTLDELIAMGERANPGPWKCERDDTLGSFIAQDQSQGAPAGWVIARLMMADDFDDDLPEQASRNGPYIVAACNAAVPLAKRLKRLAEILAWEVEQSIKCGESYFPGRPPEQVSVGTNLKISTLREVRELLTH